MSDQDKKDIKSIQFIPPAGKENVEFVIKDEDGNPIKITKATKVVESTVAIVKETNKDVALRDENVHEILTSVPHWMIRWGNFLFLFLVLLILFLSWLIRYPDTVEDRIYIEEFKSDQQYVGMISSQNYDFEKVKKGQNIQIELFAYPEHENGILHGVVDTVFWDKHSKRYITKARLSNGLITSQNVEINPNTNLEGLAKVIVKDKRLIESFFD